MILGIVAHVDAGKTTLSEAMLYESGQIRSLGRVDHKDAYLDNDLQEKERGITIFSKQARMEYQGEKIVLLDTPGHVDFSAEMERTLQVLDYAILVVSGTDGVQGHTRTLWRLLKHYEVPTFIFVNKMDLDGANQESIQNNLKKELSDACISFTEDESFYEEVAMCGEEMLDCFMETETVPKELIVEAIAQRKIFPCLYGSALKLEHVKEFMDTVIFYSKKQQYGNNFAARVYKIGRDKNGSRLTYLKVTGGSLQVKTLIEELGEKVDQIRLYSGEKFETTDVVEAGSVCAVTGLSKTVPGMALGAENGEVTPVLVPVLNYKIHLPEEINPSDMMLKLKQLEEEEPELHILWDEDVKEIHAQVMGQVQIEVLTRLIKDRFGVVVVFGQGNIVYKETIAKAVEGVGHFEPLRHYAEVHLLMEPGEPGSGITVEANCSEDVLDLNWQRLIATHVLEKEHKGVLTGSGITDIRFTIVTGKAHTKHTEGGDFRQATYRAIRQGLKSSESVLLEPMYRFILDIPVDSVGKAMTDLEIRFAKMDAPEFVEDRAVIRGKAPVSTMQDYMKEVHSYTKGLGYLTLDLDGYDVCHNTEEIVEKIGYDSEADTKNPTGSVFCAHGSGFIVPWDQVENYMHLEKVTTNKSESYEDGFSYDTTGKAFAANAFSKKKETTTNSWEMDKELQEIYAREFGMNKDALEKEERKKWKPAKVKIDKKGNPIYPKKDKHEELLIVDGYNIIFAWKELNELSRINIDSARDKLLDMLSDYQGYRGIRLMVVFDAYRIKGNIGSKNQWNNLEVIFTKTDETADAFIEKTVHDLREKYQIVVATNDGLEQLTVLSLGALRMSASMLELEIKRVKEEGYDLFKKNV